MSVSIPHSEERERDHHEIVGSYVYIMGASMNEMEVSSSFIIHVILERNVPMPLFHCYPHSIKIVGYSSKEHPPQKRNISILHVSSAFR